jgi:membrane-associated phospholipid phosphatase
MRTFAIVTLGLALSGAVNALAWAAAPSPVGRSEGWLGVPVVELARLASSVEARPDSADTKRMSFERGSQDPARTRWWSAGGPAYRWNEIAVEATLDEFVTLPLAARHLALVHVAIDDAIAAAALAGTSRAQPVLQKAVPATLQRDRLRPSLHAAAASAAATVLADLFPQRAAQFGALADEAIRIRIAGGAEQPGDVAAGREIGTRVAALVVAHGKSDRSDAKWTGSVPDAPGKWQGKNPIAPAAAGWRAYTLARADELRPQPPPAYDSARGVADLAELKAYARSPRSNHRATYWEVFGGARAHALWNETARLKLLEYGDAFDAQSSARMLAMVNIALLDSAIACWEAKYAYWQMRPSQFDADVKPVFPPPNHPSYPAAHGCLSTAAATVLAAAFPADREALLARGNEAAEARIWAGIHTRSDIEAGQEIGRRVAERVLERGAWPARPQ